jgi:cell division septation protein DedD
VNLAAHTQDDGFHEIQLNGKQLVFLFMAATVVSVVIFLCGVLVGRGVRTEQAAADQAAGLSVAAEPAPLPSGASSVEAPAGSDPTAAAAPPTVDDLSYFDRLQGTGQPQEQLKPAEPPAAETSPVAARAAATADAREPQGAGFAVQIAALNIRSEADAIATRLASKGYAAYVTSPASGTPQIYRVRIGKFESRRDAETMAAKLEKEEQFKPWVTR